MAKNSSPLESILFPAGADADKADWQSRLLEQYKLLVQTSEALVARRQTVNTFFLSINTFLLSATGILATQRLSARLGGLSLVALGMAGFVLCFAWRRLVISYRQLNAGKFEVIHLIEKHLPASIFHAEWEALGSGKDKTKYYPFTRTEGCIPWLFGAVYAFALIGGILLLLGIGSPR